MNFDLNVHPSSICNDGVLDTMITKIELFIKREEVITNKEKDEIAFYQTLRSMIYMYHYPYGYVTQMTDDAMRDIYQLMKDGEQYKGVSFQILHKEAIGEEGDSHSRRAQSIELNMYCIE